LSYTIGEEAVARDLDLGWVFTPSIELCLSQPYVLRCRYTSTRNSNDGRHGEALPAVVLLSILFWQPNPEIFQVLQLLRKRLLSMGFAV
jgi:hypothetical protein